MQGAEHKVTGECRLNRNLSRLEVSNLTNENRIGILTQDRPQATRKSHTDIGINRDLDDPINVILNRIFGCDQLVFDVVQLG